jgi:hypothetical protein
MAPTTTEQAAPLAEALEDLARYETDVIGMQLNNVVASCYRICNLLRQHAADSKTA